MLRRILRSCLLLVLLVGNLSLPASAARAARLERDDRMDGGSAADAAPRGVVAMLFELLDSLGLAADADLGPSIDPTGVEVDSTSSGTPPSGLGGDSTDLAQPEQP